jgi:uncharacterized protein
MPSASACRKLGDGVCDVGDFVNTFDTSVALVIATPYAACMTESVLDTVWDEAKARANLIKHRVSFIQAASVLLDPLALSVFDAAHSDPEDRWFTLGQTPDGVLLAIAHTHETLDDNHSRVRLISARHATRRERLQYEGKSG